ncbi:MAG: Gfo/Idh/MocA family oxidoreductase [Armatimonadetes bacterium]|nr:Gfo/Idh/MocA family oxidoreductase [Armatimonadota bacterium]MDE2205904.1 Gfo/Idh/MocA family oxidoreductase [Armatimonadota bacterium]
MPPEQPTQDPKQQLAEAIRQLSVAFHEVKERVVVAVMRRNRLQDQVTAAKRVLEDRQAKRRTSEQLNDPQLLKDLDADIKSRQQELDGLNRMLVQAEVEADTAKTALPVEQGRLLEQLREMKARFGEAIHQKITNSGWPTAADELLDRAFSKSREIQHEAAAREEASAAAAGQARTVQPVSRIEMPSESTLDEMLSALEAKVRGDVPAEALDGPAAQPASAPPVAPPVTEATPPAVPALAPPAVPGIPVVQSTSAPVIAPAVIRKEIDMDSNRRVRVAGIGTGGIYRGAHLPAYPHIPHAQLVALCDPDPEAQKLALARHHSVFEAKIKELRERKETEAADLLERDRDAVQVRSDISEVIAQDNVDLVDICTQPFLHAPLSIQALNAGLNVMCEKPLSRSWLESKRLLAAVERSGRFYQHNENWLWDPDYYSAMKLVRSGAIGEPLLMFFATAHGGPEGNGKFWNSEFGGGGSLLDNGIHAIGAAWYIAGMSRRPKLVKAADPFGMQIRMPHRIIDGRFQQVRVEDDAHILIRFEDPNTGAWTSAHVEGSWSERDSPDTVIIGTTGKIRFESNENGRFAVVVDAWDRDQRRLFVSGPTWQHWPSSFYGEILNMVECVRNGVPSISTASFGAECSAIVGCSYLSQKEGRRAVSLDEFKAFAEGIESRYPGDAKAADDALVDALLSAVRPQD